MAWDSIEAPLDSCWKPPWMHAICSMKVPGEEEEACCAAALRLAQQPSLANLHSSPKPFISNFTLPLPTLSNPNLSPNLPTSNNLHHQLFAGPPITAVRRRPPPSSSIVFNYKFMERFFKRKLSTDSSSPSNPGSSNARPIEVDEILANLQALD
ncbi:unnamed protein product [Prunus armeniaca]